MKTKLHLLLIIALSLVWLILSAHGDVALSAWQPPIGIPAPSFGIEETYRMYDNPANRNPELTYHQNAEGGFYTHYVDNTHPNATNTDNPYGTASKPRRTIPDNLSEGSVVEMHGTYPGGGYSVIEGEGTLLKPIFIRGLSQGERGIVSPQFIPEGSYMIFENIDFNGGGFVTSASRLAHHISLRHCELRNRPTQTIIGVVGPQSQPTHDIVIYDNKVHNADETWDEPGADVDAGGVGIGRFAHRVWVLDNHFYHNAGAAIGAGQYGYGMMDVHHLYYGRNHCHDNRQSSIGSKVATHVIVSENILHSHKTSQLQEGNYGGGISYQYGPENIWILFNKIYDSEVGIKIGSSSGGNGLNNYFIGNLIYNISHSDTGSTAGAGISIRGDIVDSHYYLINNIIYNTKSGINRPSWPVMFLDIINNIVSNMNGGKHVDIVTQSVDLTLNNNLLYQGGAPVTIKWGDSQGDVGEFEAAHPANAQDNIEADPLFVDVANADFHLQPTSPAIDAGIESEVYQRFYELYGIDIGKDIEGRRRPQGSAWDIGTYEYDASPPSNKPPIANAGPNQTVTDKDKDGSEQVSLDGSASSDPDGTIVSFVWSEDGLQIATGVNPTVTLSTGTHSITLTVTDDEGLTDTDTVTITVSSLSNQPPVADAGPDQTVIDSDRNGSEQVTLDGSASSDPDGTIVSFAWTKDGQQIATGVNPTVTLSTGTHTITLTVTDNGGLTNTDTVIIKVLEGEGRFGELPAGCYNNVINPSRGEIAIIVVEIEQQGEVKIDLYDTQGRRIRQLADEEREPGRHRYYWNGRNDNGDVVGSGLYFVHIQAGDYKKTKKIVVVK